MTNNAASQAGTVAPHEFLMQLGTTKMPHSGRSLYEHLAGVSAILYEWGQPECVYLAGMFHSIYSTAKYKRAALPVSERHRLRAVIGGEAEQLAYFFSALPAATVFRAAEADTRFLSDGSIELPCRWNHWSASAYLGESCRALLRCISPIIWSNDRNPLPEPGSGCRGRATWRKHCVRFPMRCRAS